MNGERKCYSFTTHDLKSSHDFVLLVLARSLNDLAVVPDVRTNVSSSRVNIKKLPGILRLRCRSKHNLLTNSRKLLGLSISNDRD